MLEKKNKDLVMSREEIVKAAQQLKEIEDRYPEFFKLHIMILQLHNTSFIKSKNENGVRFDPKK